MKNKNASPDAPPPPAAPAALPDVSLLMALPFLCYDFSLPDKVKKFARLKAVYPVFVDRLVKKALKV